MNDSIDWKKERMVWCGKLEILVRHFSTCPVTHMQMLKQKDTLTYYRPLLSALATNETVALKQIKFDSEMTKEGFPVTALREISVLLSLSHECVVSVREMVVGNAFDKVFMVMEVSLSVLRASLLLL